MEAHEIDILSLAVLGDFEEIDDTEEARFARQLRCDVRVSDRRDIQNGE